MHIVTVFSASWLEYLGPRSSVLQLDANRHHTTYGFCQHDQCSKGNNQNHLANCQEILNFKQTQAKMLKRSLPNSVKITQEILK